MIKIRKSDNRRYYCYDQKKLIALPDILVYIINDKDFFIVDVNGNDITTETLYKIIITNELELAKPECRGVVKLNNKSLKRIAKYGTFTEYLEDRDTPDLAFIYYPE